MAGASTSRQDAELATEDDFTQNRALISELYMGRNMTLLEVKDHMLEEYGFNATYANFVQELSDGTLLRLPQTQDVQESPF